VINPVFASICAAVMLGLILATQGMKVWAKLKGKAVVCAACGRTVVDSPVKIEEGGSDIFFCCQHCADAYIKGARDRSDGKIGKDNG
jgi:hypothetical protein